MNKDAQLIAEAYNKVLEASLSYDREGNAYDSLQDYHNANVAKEQALKQYDQGQDSPYTRGEFDSYNRHPKQPHYYIRVEGGKRRVEEKDMSPEEIEAYNAGYEDNEKAHDFRDYTR